MVIFSPQEINSSNEIGEPEVTGEIAGTNQSMGSKNNLWITAERMRSDPVDIARFTISSKNSSEILQKSIEEKMSGKHFDDRAWIHTERLIKRNDDSKTEN